MRPPGAEKNVSTRPGHPTPEKEIIVPGRPEVGVTSVMAKGGMVRRRLWFHGAGQTRTAPGRGGAA